MTVTILFFWLVAQGFVAPVQTIEFDDPKACAAALEQLQAAYAKTQAFAGGATGICVAKASPPPPSCTFANGKAYCTPAAVAAQ